MTATPPKIKAFLATTKEKALDNAEANLEFCFQALVRLELVQRGVIVGEHDDNEDKLVLALQTNAGKALLEESSLPKIPKPLLAGAAVLTGRVCEKIVALLRSSAETNHGNTTTLLSQDAIRATLDRCKQVEERRFAVLLRICSDIQEENSETDTVTRAVRRLLYVAEGNFCRAASFQPDAPPMWKKAWDMIGERQSLQADDPTIASPEEAKIHWEAVTALSHLVRIAGTKGNAKRVTELSLRWSESLLDNIHPVKAITDDHLRECIETYVAPYRSIDPMPAEKASQEAARILQDANLLDQSQLTEQDAFIYLLVDLGAHFAQEEALILKAAEENLQLAQNRAQEGSKSKPKAKIALADHVPKARRQHLAASLDDAPMDKSAACLRKAMFQSTAPSVSSRRREEGHALLLRYLTRQQDRAQAMALQSKKIEGWLSLAEYVRPVLAFWLSGEPVENPLQETKVYEAIVCAVPTIEWMLCARNGSSIFQATQIVQCRDMASALYKQASTGKPNDASAGVVSSKAADQSIVRLECALASLNCLAALELEVGATNTQDVVRQLTERAVGRSDTIESFPVLACELGFAYVEFLLAWSGLHRPPWPFCTQPEARALVTKAGACVARAEKEWGRPASSLEHALLCLAEADAETISFTGGLPVKAQQGYHKVIELAGTIASREHADLLIARSDTGLARLAMNEQKTLATTETKSTAEDLAKKTLDRLQAMEQCSASLYLWRATESTKASMQQQVAMARQLVADTLIQSGKATAARQFLADAVKDAPQDPSAAFALGAFMLRMMFFGSSANSPESEKAAQVQLLKAAKLDATNASAFALLGFWFEFKGDDKRALGCYAKALVLDPAHPVAGRGFLRMAPSEDARKLLDKAIRSSAPLVGWAWRAVATQKALIEGKDDLAVVALVKALRCRDIERPEAESLSVFYASPLTPSVAGKGELSHVHAELAACYRRLGRYTASIRSYHAAIDDMDGHVSSLVLCACAQVELELGLLDDAVEKFSTAFNDKTMQSVAAYGQGVALLALAQRDVQDGKAGFAFESIKRAIQACEEVNDGGYGCVQKLLGDLHTFGSSLPPDVFGGDETCEAQVAFIAKGEDAYQKAEAAIALPPGEEMDALRSGLLTDFGANLLLQAQLLAFSGECEKATAAFERSAVEFRRALDTDSLYAPAWCGLGCAVAKSDPLLSQHAFCRALELDHLLTDAYANLSFLYTSHDRFEPSASLSDALTQIADTPMMWINRALILERQGNPKQAADAYAAALQVVEEPAATLGLALNLRQSATTASSARQVGESLGLVTEYLGRVGVVDSFARVAQGLLSMEEGSFSTPSRGKQTLEQARLQVLDILDQRGNDDAKSLEGWDVTSVRASVSAVESEEEKTQADAPQILTLARQVLLAPHRGDLWVAYTKELALAGKVESAAIAATKASSLLGQQWSSRSKGHGDQAAGVQAEVFSDALALQYWLELQLGGDKTASPSARNVGLQRSLLMCPDNALARQALEQSLATAESV